MSQIHDPMTVNFGSILAVASLNHSVAEVQFSLVHPPFLENREPNWEVCARTGTEQDMKLVFEGDDGGGVERSNRPRKRAYAARF
jgi:hypothetical protein